MSTSMSLGTSATISAKGPGRVNLMGDHTDYNLGLALPIAIDLCTSVEFAMDGSDSIAFSSTAYADSVELPVDLDPNDGRLGAIEPPWARLLGAMVALTRPSSGGAVHIASTVPTGSGLSSSAALCVALAQVFGVEGPARSTARLCQQAEHLVGVPVGIMDPLACTASRAGHALCIDFADLSTVDVAVPGGAEIVVVDSGEHRRLGDTAYAARVVECEAVAVTIGPLGQADRSDLPGLRDPVLRRRVRHVIGECERVHQMSEAFDARDLATAGALMSLSHRSSADDFEVSTPIVDQLVEYLSAQPGVYGARLTGAGFGGCVVALAAPGAIDVSELPTPAWRVEPSDGTSPDRL